MSEPYKPLDLARISGTLAGAGDGEIYGICPHCMGEIAHETNCPLLHLLTDAREARKVIAALAKELSSCVDSLDYVQRNFPNTGGWGVRDERIRKSCDVIFLAAPWVEGV